MAIHDIPVNLSHKQIDPSGLPSPVGDPPVTRLFQQRLAQVVAPPVAPVTPAGPGVTQPAPVMLNPSAWPGSTQPAPPALTPYTPPPLPVRPATNPATILHSAGGKAQLLLNQLTRTLQALTRPFSKTDLAAWNAALGKISSTLRLQAISPAEQLAINQQADLNPRLNIRYAIGLQTPIDGNLALTGSLTELFRFFQTGNTQYFQPFHSRADGLSLKGLQQRYQHALEQLTDTRVLNAARGRLKSIEHVLKNHYPSLTLMAVADRSSESNGFQINQASDRGNGQTYIIGLDLPIKMTDRSTRQVSASLAGPLQALGTFLINGGYGWLTANGLQPNRSTGVTPEGLVKRYALAQVNPADLGNGTPQTGSTLTQHLNTDVELPPANDPESTVNTTLPFGSEKQKGISFKPGTNDEQDKNNNGLISIRASKSLQTPEPNTNQQNDGPIKASDAEQPSKAQAESQSPDKTTENTDPKPAHVLLVQQAKEKPIESQGQTGIYQQVEDLALALQQLLNQWDILSANQRKDEATHILNNILTINKIPSIRIELGKTDGGLAEFSSKTRIMTIESNRTSFDISDKQDIRRLFSALAHELRHADQDFAKLQTLIHKKIFTREQLTRHTYPTYAVNQAINTKPDDSRIAFGNYLLSDLSKSKLDQYNATILNFSKNLDLFIKHIETLRQQGTPLAEDATYQALDRKLAHDIQLYLSFKNEADAYSFQGLFERAFEALSQNDQAQESTTDNTETIEKHTARVQRLVEHFLDQHIDTGSGRSRLVDSLLDVVPVLLTVPENIRPTVWENTLNYIAQEMLDALDKHHPSPKPSADNYKAIDSALTDFDTFLRKTFEPSSHSLNGQQQIYLQLNPGDTEQNAHIVRVLGYKLFTELYAKFASKKTNSPFQKLVHKLDTEIQSSQHADEYATAYEKYKAIVKQCLKIVLSSKYPVHYNHDNAAVEKFYEQQLEPQLKPGVLDD